MTRGWTRAGLSSGAQAARRSLLSGDGTDGVVFCPGGCPTPRGSLRDRSPGTRCARRRGTAGASVGFCAGPRVATVSHTDHTCTLFPCRSVARRRLLRCSSDLRPTFVRGSFDGGGSSVRRRRAGGGLALALHRRSSMGEGSSTRGECNGNGSEQSDSSGAVRDARQAAGVAPAEGRAVHRGGCAAPARRAVGGAATPSGALPARERVREGRAGSTRVSGRREGARDHGAERCHRGFLAAAPSGAGCDGCAAHDRK